MQPLLAKSIPDGASAPADGADPPSWTLVGHTGDVLKAVAALFGTPDDPTRLGRSWLRFFGLEESDHDRFLRHLRIAAAAHDWGKANEGFQAVVHRRCRDQAFRHEHLSVLFLADKPIVDWLRGADVDAEAVLAAILAHHVKARRSHGEGEAHVAVAFEPLGARDFEKVHADHPDFLAIRDAIAAEVGSAFPAGATKWTPREIERRAKFARGLLDRFAKALESDDARRRLFVAVRAALIVADAAGSARPRMGTTLDEWIREAFAKELTADEIGEKVIERRIAELESRSRGKAFEFSTFQTEIAAEGPRVLMKAPCGSGKTLAAWNWIKARLAERPAARVVFLYPTRATATEGFRDYVSWAPEADAALMSGTSAYELDGMFDSAEDDRRGRDFRADPRLFALGHWRKRIFSATADQFFPFLQYAYGPLCMLPVLAESIVVVDEVHSFDESMYSTLRHFLAAFPSVPVLCMTATLPEQRRDDLERTLGLSPFPREMPEDLKKVADHPRYEVRWIDPEDVERVTRDALEGGKRVLRVCNRVDACRAAFESVYENSDPGEAPTAFCYHSRFKLSDRQERHKEVVAAFKPTADGEPPRAVYAATTQVCEMSLDLDADVLVTDLAPISSLIQRMGRCNRDPKRMFERPPGVVYVVRRGSDGPNPYEADELKAAENFVDELVNLDGVSQEKLEDVYKVKDVQAVEPLKHCRFLSGDPYASSADDDFRDIDEFTAPCVLDCEVEKVARAAKDREPIDGFLVPVPKHIVGREGDQKDSRLPKWLRVAPGWRYDKRSGYDGRPDKPTEGDPRP